jgi:hypothetical protein
MVIHKKNQKIGHRKRVSRETMGVGKNAKPKLSKLLTGSKDIQIKSMRELLDSEFL